MQLIEPTGDQTYIGTARWAAALHAWPGDRTWGPADGICWISRMDNRARAVVLFGDRVLVGGSGRDNLVVQEAQLPLEHGVGYSLVETMATEALVTIIR
jgi:hypothetical protein